MSESFLQRVKSRLGGGGAPGGGPPQAVLAAFGKHPAHDEHTADLANHPKAVAFRDALYTRGVRTVVDSGRWSETERAGGQLEPFGHLLLGTFAGDTVVALVGASRDSVGRDKYPFVLGAICPNVSPDAAVGHVLPRLTALQKECAVATSLPALQAVLGRARADLATIAESLPADPPADEGPAAGGTEALANHPSLGPDHQGLLRVLYQVEYELSAYHGQKPAKAARARHLRVPPCADAPADAALRWIALLHAQLDPSTPVLAVVPAGRPWLDLLVGPFTDAELFCLRAGPAALPLSTDVPFPINDAVRTRAQALLGPGAGPVPPPSSALPPPPPAPVVPPPSSPLPVAQTIPPTVSVPAPASAPVPARPDDVPEAGKRSSAVVLGAASAVLAAGAIGYVVLRPAPKPVAVVANPSPSVTPAPAPVQAPPAPQPAVTAPPAPAATPVAALPPDSRKDWAAPARLDRAAAAIGALPPAARAPLEARVATLRNRLAEVRSAAWSAELPAHMRRIDADVDGVIADAGAAAKAAAAAAAALAAERKAFRASLASAPDLRSPTLAKAWADAAGRLASEADVATDLAPLAQRQGDLRRRLAALDTDARLNASAPAPLENFVTRHREAALAGILAATSPQAELALKAAHADAVREASRVLADLSDVAARIRAGQAVRVDAALRSLAGHKLLDDPAFAAAAGSAAPVVRSYLQLQDAARAELVDAVSANATSPANRLAAWRRLGNPALAWPGTAKELIAEHAAATRLKGDFAAAGPIQSELAAGTAGRRAAFARGLHGAPAEDTLEALAASRDAAGGAADEELLPALRYDLLLYEAKRPLPAAMPDDLRRFLDEAAPLRADPAVAAALESLAAPPPRPPAPPPAAAPDGRFPGPTAAQWTPAASPTPGELSFVWQQRTLTFRRVQPAGATSPVYVSIADVPAALFVDWLNDTRSLKAETEYTRRSIRSNGRNNADPRVASPKAPAAWSLDARTGRLSVSEQPHAPAAAADPAVQCVPAALALHFAATLGCRLPTEAELRAAGAPADRYEFVLTAPAAAADARKDGRAAGFAELVSGPAKAVTLAPAAPIAPDMASNPYLSFTDTFFRLAFPASEPPSAASPAPAPVQSADWVRTRFAEAKYVPVP